MPRSLSVQRTVVPVGEREKYLERARRRREHYKRANCSFWLFEDSGLPGAFVEFTEGPSVDDLKAAHDGSPERPLDPGRIYQEVQLS